MSDGEKPEEPGPERKKRGRPKKRRRAGKKSAINGSKKASRRHVSRAREDDPDATAAGKRRTLDDIQREVRIELLLERLAEHGEEITIAARALKIDRKTLWRWRKDIPDLERDLADAYRAGTESLADVARVRAVDGWDEPVFYQGKQCGTVRKYDHGLLQFIMRKRDVSYADPREAAPVTPPKLPGEISLDLDKMPPELLEALEKEAQRQAEAARASGGPAL